MKTKLFYFLTVITLFVFMHSCTKTSNCECNTPFVLGNYYSPGNIVNHNNACWLYRIEANPSYVTSIRDIPMDTFPIAQDLWIKICEKPTK